MFDLLDNMDPLHEKKDPTISFILGFFCGGIGLGIYFRSLVDAIMPLVVLVILSVAIPVGGTIFGAILAGLYGYYRAVSSNKMIGL